MRLTTLFTVSFAVLIAAAAALPTAADAAAAPKKRVAYRPVPVTLDSPPRARITVRRQSFLEGGPQVIPGTDPATHYIWTSPNQYPGDVLRYTTFDRSRETLPGPGYLPGRNNPWPFFWCSGC
jgi:hypothetical protein